ncbi:DDE superfamily endonuclease [Nitzschia inconspicua]|uniref:DDE superfamily endonuclease n=1 Tax=Nitzschia inconspicua TaxID=303405 RepID=A0A9K3LML7_9STRA|nr:DDE superfamily endonuclease [Nitzschia inconspicua]
MSSSTAAMYVFSQVALAIAICHRIRKKSEPRKKGRPAARVRQRRSVQDVYECLGPTYFHRAYRMSYESFWILHDKLRDGIEEALKEKQTKVPDEGGKLHNRAPPIPNGPICSSVRLACAIRYFAGGSPYDISVMYGLSYSTTMSCVWAVVDAINHHKEFFIEYPESHDEQRSIAEGFKKASTPGIDICAGAVDGILIWTNKPTVDECNFLGVGQKKFLCGRKHKFGLNCQAVSDARGRFLDISIVYGGATSDCLAFERSKLFECWPWN